MVASGKNASGHPTHPAKPAMPVCEDVYDLN